MKMNSGKESFRWKLKDEKSVREMEEQIVVQDEVIFVETKVGHDLKATQVVELWRLKNIFMITKWFYEAHWRLEKCWQ